MEGFFTLLLYAGLFYLMMRFGCGAHMVHGHGGHGQNDHRGHDERSPSRPDALTAGLKAVDPVCGMEVAPDSGYTKVYAGRTFHLCSRPCLDTFEASPQQYVA